MEHFTLYNGIALPVTAFGVCRTPADDKTARYVTEAIEAGYRHIYTAQSFLNEAEIGEGIRRSSVPRQNIVITTGLRMQYHNEQAAYDAVLASVESLGVSYIDTVLLSHPAGDYYGAWRALETLYQEGVVRTIGVSNFTAERLADLCTHSLKRPAINLLGINPLCSRRDLEAIHKKLGVRLAARSPLGAGSGVVLKNHLLTDIGKRHGKSSAQVVLRWLYQRGIVSVVNTAQPLHMRENTDIFDFALSEMDMALIATQDEYGEDLRDLERAEAVEGLIVSAEECRDRR